MRRAYKARREAAGNGTAAAGWFDRTVDWLEGQTAKVRVGRRNNPEWRPGEGGDGESAGKGGWDERGGGWDEHGAGGDDGVWDDNPSWHGHFSVTRSLIPRNHGTCCPSQKALYTSQLLAFIRKGNGCHGRTRRESRTWAGGDSDNQARPHTASAATTPAAYAAAITAAAAAKMDATAKNKKEPSTSTSTSATAANKEISTTASTSTSTSTSTFASTSTSTSSSPSTTSTTSTANTEKVASAPRSPPAPPAPWGGDPLADPNKKPDFVFTLGEDDDLSSADAFAAALKARHAPDTKGRGSRGGSDGGGGGAGDGGGGGSGGGGGEGGDGSSGGSGGYGGGGGEGGESSDSGAGGGVKKLPAYQQEKRGTRLADTTEQTQTHAAAAGLAAAAKAKEAKAKGSVSGSGMVKDVHTDITVGCCKLKCVLNAPDLRSRNQNTIDCVKYLPSISTCAPMSRCYTPRHSTLPRGWRGAPRYDLAHVVRHVIDTHLKPCLLSHGGVDSDAEVETAAAVIQRRLHDQRPGSYIESLLNKQGFTCGG